LDWGATLYGAGGGLLGKGYEIARDFYKENIQPTVERIENVGNSLDKINPLKYFKKEYTKKPKKQSRRTFLKSILNLAHEHPKTAGATAGAIYGGGKTGVKDYFKRGDKLEIADLKNRIGELEEKVSEDSKQDTLLIIGFVGILFSIILTSLNLTGLSIFAKEIPRTYNLLNIILFISSLALIFFRSKKQKT